MPTHQQQQRRQQQAAEPPGVPPGVARMAAEFYRWAMMFPDRDLIDGDERKRTAEWALDSAEDFASALHARDRQRRKERAERRQQQENRR